MIEFLTIEGFRCFRTLDIPRLGQINLIMGRNGAGKSTLLEALHLFLSSGSMAVIVDLLDSRDEVDRVTDWPFLFINLPRLFNFTDADSPEKKDGRLEIKTNIQTLAISTCRKSEGNSNGPRKNSFGEFKILIMFGDVLQQIDFTLEPVDREKRRWKENSGSPNYEFLKMSSIAHDQILRFLDMVALTGREEAVLASLAAIRPDVRAISAVGRPGRSSGRQEEDERTLIVKLSGTRMPVPARSLGDGFMRLLLLSLVANTREGGILMIDEIENGIHHSVLVDLWTLIFDTAARQNLQVFATTHSLDCVAAFAHVALSRPQIPGLALRLERVDGEHRAVVYDPSDLEVAIRHDIEVR